MDTQQLKQFILTQERESLSRILHHPECPAEILEIASTHVDPFVRMDVAESKVISIDVLARLAIDKNSRVRKAAFGNLNVNEEIIALFDPNEGSWEIKALVAEHPLTPLKLRRALRYSGHKKVASAAIRAEKKQLESLFIRIVGEPSRYDFREDNQDQPTRVIPENDIEHVEVETDCWEDAASTLENFFGKTIFKVDLDTQRVVNRAFLFGRGGRFAILFAVGDEYWDGMYEGWDLSCHELRKLVEYRHGEGLDIGLAEDVLLQIVFAALERGDFSC